MAPSGPPQEDIVIRHQEIIIWIQVAVELGDLLPKQRGGGWFPLKLSLFSMQVSPHTPGHQEAECSYLLGPMSALSQPCFSHIWLTVISQTVIHLSLSLLAGL